MLSTGLLVLKFSLSWAGSSGGTESMGSGHRELGPVAGATTTRAGGLPTIARPLPRMVAMPDVGSSCTVAARARSGMDVGDSAVAMWLVRVSCGDNMASVNVLLVVSGFLSSYGCVAICDLTEGVGSC